LTYLKQVPNQSSVLAMSYQLISPEKTSLKTSFQEFVSLQSATGTSHPGLFGQ
jgi:hypothetical protein